MSVSPYQRSSTVAGAFEIAIIGAGRVGCAIGRTLAERGHRIVAASTKSPASAVRVREVLGDVPLASPEDAALTADIIVIAVPDDALGQISTAIAGARRDGATIVHTSGLHGIAALAGCGERVSAVHPAQAISSPFARLNGVWFGITCSDEMISWSNWFVAQLDGVPLRIEEEKRALYHAALCMASNFAVALAGDAQDMIPDRRILGPLLRQTVENIIATGADSALTGPIVRADVGTVRAHLAALPADLLDSYVANARRTLYRAVESGRLDSEGARRVAAVLDEVLVR